MDVLKNVSDAVTDKPVDLTVDILPQGRIHAFLQRVGIIPKQKVFKVRQITLGNLIRISGLLVSMDVDFKNEEKYLENIYDAMSNQGDNVAKIVAIALHNQLQEPPKSLINFVKSNFASNELLLVSQIVFKQMNVGNFMLSIVSMKGANILQTSQKVQGS